MVKDVLKLQFKFNKKKQLRCYKIMIKDIIK